MRFRWKEYAAFLLVMLYAIPVLLNLDLVPVAWLDETMNLDPAVQWHLRGKFVSALWPNQGSERQFLCYLPLVEWLHMLNLGLVPWEMFWVRLPFVVLFLAAAVCFYLWTERCLRLPKSWSLLLLCLLLFDKSIFEILRSVRSETLELALLAIWLFLCFRSPKSSFIPLLAGMLLMAHPKLWPAMGIGMLCQWMLQRSSMRFWLWPVITLVPACCYFLWLDAPFADWWRQLQGQAEMHQASGNRISAHFLTRYWPYFKEQPWMPLLHLCTWFPAYSLWKKHGWGLQSMPAMMWAVQDLSWLLILAPHHRYLPPHHLLMYAVWGLWLATEQVPVCNRRQRLLLLPLLPLLLFPYASRMSLGLLQRDERNPESVLRWLDRELPAGQSGRTLVIGNSIGHYHILRHRDTGMHFALEIYPQKFRFADFSRVYYLGRRISEMKGTSYQLDPPRYAIPTSMSTTYRGLVLTRLESADEMEAIVGAYRISYP